MAAWIKMPLGMEVNLGPGDLVWGPHSPFPIKGQTSNFLATYDKPLPAGA